MKPVQRFSRYPDTVGEKDLDDTIPIPTANQPTENEDESGEARRDRAKELQKAYLATSSGKEEKEEEEEAEALPVVLAACDRAHCRHNKGERFKQ